MKNILFLNSYSKAATSHYRFALKMAQRLRATLHLVHIYDFRDPLDKEGAIFSSKKDFNQWLLNLQREESLELEKFISDHTGKQNFPLIGETFTFEGSPNENIERLLEVQNYDLIIMGMRKKSIFSNLMDTGLTQYLIDTSDCPILMLPSENKGNTIIKRICIASDLSDEAASAINYVFDLSIQLSANFSMLTVVSKKQDVEEKETRITELQKTMHGGYSSKFIYEIIVGDPGEIISSYCENNGLDLLVLTTRQRKRWISQFEQTITKDLARKASLPLLILKEEYVSNYAGL